MRSALLLVDLQNDFFPGGALATPEGDDIIAPVNDLVDKFHNRQLPIFATADSHPEGHCSFEAQGGPWPPHCLKDTLGAAFHPAIKLPDDVVAITKGEQKNADAYSGFDGTDLAARLEDRDVDELVVAGLATDVCVHETVLDAIKEGFDVQVVEEAVSGVELEPGDCERALDEMREAGAEVVSLEDVSIRG